MPILRNSNTLVTRQICVMDEWRIVTLAIVIKKVQWASSGPMKPPWISKKSEISPKSINVSPSHDWEEVLFNVVRRQLPIPPSYMGLTTPTLPKTFQSPSLKNPSKNLQNLLKIWKNPLYFINILQHQFASWLMMHWLLLVKFSSKKETELQNIKETYYSEKKKLYAFT